MLAEESFGDGAARCDDAGGGGGSEANSEDTTLACDVPGSENVNRCIPNRGEGEGELVLGGGGGGGGGARCDAGGGGGGGSEANSEDTIDACDVPGSLNMNLCRLGRGLPWGSG